MQVDSFLATYNMNSALLEDVSKNGKVSSAKNYAKAEFEDILQEQNLKNLKKAEEAKKNFNEATMSFSPSAKFNQMLMNEKSGLNFKESEVVDESKLSEKEKEKLAYEKALKEQTDAFEAFLVKTVLDVSMKNKASMFEKDASDEIYSSMYNDTMSKALSGGMGFSELLFNFLTQKS